ncbi:IS66 family insertion sequence element accessory protein TnpB (plasmid) [Bradyrhizobium quebecense]|uniref:IS66 family insertion sequence element accessory protein TnpB n=1 Tax=Bradyrhizobium quebecense TaxID=2748629 RepID=UPI001CD766EE|nr:IS66 family insertion sequence element accessory protein TnpB [Bradyrhizobium quebecense]UGA49011.1 IS66 family insertion sequence element accessory protein TnpB [Bradyrhizobium quebecense]
MIPVAAGVRIWIASGHTDIRKGMNGLALLVQEGLGRDPFAGDVFVFRGRAGQRPTFCIQSSKRDNCISVASFWTNASSRTVPTRQGFEVHLHGGMPWV